jgi:signal peptidase I
VGERPPERPEDRRPAGEGDRPSDPEPVGARNAHATTTTLSPREREKAEKAEKARQKEERRRGPLGFFRELPGLILIAFLLALLIKTFLVQAFYIPSQSMVPTLRVGDRVLVNKLIYDFRDPRRGEVIVFVNPQYEEPERNPLAAFWHWLTEGLGFSTDPNKDFIKRVVALPGETIEIKNGQVFIDGEPIDEPYLNRLRDTTDMDPRTISADELFVMGDNRPNSQDSRSSLGTIPYDRIVGKAFVILWPPSRIGWLSGD